jgi:hypothetical protein
MSTTEHLQLIKAECERLLAIAEKRTQGEWQVKINRAIANHHVQNTICGSFPWGSTDMDFIAACAGRAEAGWRATIAAVDAFEYIGNIEAFGQPILETFLAAWPVELLANKPQ